MLLIVIVVVLVRAEDVKEVVIASAQELKGIKVEKITWKKDGAKIVRTKLNQLQMEPLLIKVHS